MRRQVGQDRVLQYGRHRSQGTHKRQCTSRVRVQPDGKLFVLDRLAAEGHRPGPQGNGQQQGSDSGPDGERDGSEGNKARRRQWVESLSGEQRELFPAVSVQAQQDQDLRLSDRLRIDQRQTELRETGSVFVVHQTRHHRQDQHQEREQRNDYSHSWYQTSKVGADTMIFISQKEFI